VYSLISAYLFEENTITRLALFWCHRDIDISWHYIRLLLYMTFRQLACSRIHWDYYNNGYAKQAYDVYSGPQGKH